MAKKFEYQEFSENQVIIPNNGTQEDTINGPINKIISDHVVTMLPEEAEAATDSLSDSNSKDLEETEKSADDQNSDINDSDTEELQHTDTLTLTKEELEKIKSESYQNGITEGRQEVSKTLDQNAQKEENKFAQEIINKLSTFPLEQSISADYIDLVAIFLDEMKEKIIVSLPTDFSKVVSAQLKKLIETSYKSGSIILRVNPENIGHIEKIIQNDELSLQAQNITVIPDEKVLQKDCVLEYESAKLVYDTALIKREIDEILKQFKQDSQ